MQIKYVLFQREGLAVRWKYYISTLYVDESGWTLATFIDVKCIMECDVVGWWDYRTLKRFEWISRITCVISLPAG